MFLASCMIHINESSKLEGVWFYLMVFYLLNLLFHPGQAHTCISVGIILLIPDNYLKNKVLDASE